MVKLDHIVFYDSSLKHPTIVRSTHAAEKSTDLMYEWSLLGCSDMRVTYEELFTITQLPKWHSTAGRTLFLKIFCHCSYKNEGCEFGVNKKTSGNYILEITIFHRSVLIHKRTTFDEGVRQGKQMEQSKINWLTDWNICSSRSPKTQH